jgi:acetyltransferase-like isoleucine patch superfamily enzyme
MAITCHMLPSISAIMPPLGAKSIIMSYGKIGNSAIVAAGLVVLKHTQIGHGEVWAGVPAKRIRQQTL